MDWRFWVLHFVRFVLVFGLPAILFAFMVVFLHQMRFVNGLP